MFTLTVHYHMQDTQRLVTDDPKALILSLNMAMVRDFTCDRNE